MRKETDKFIQQSVHTAEAEASVKLCFLHKRVFLFILKSAWSIHSFTPTQTPSTHIHLNMHTPKEKVMFF